MVSIAPQAPAQHLHQPSLSASIQSSPGPSSPPPSSLQHSPPAIHLHPAQSIESHQPTPLSGPSTSPIPLDPFLTSLDHQLIPSEKLQPDPPQPTLSSLKPSISTPTSIPRLPKAKLIQSNLLNHSAQCALKTVWDTLSSAKASDPPKLEISRNLDCLFGELHAVAIPFKQDALALIWPQSISNKSLKASFNTRRSLAYFSIRRANIAFVAEYILYAMPGEEAYGKNDIVFACEGFLPLVLDPELVLEPRSWKLFNELKIQIYIQRLDQSGANEANSRVLPNLFVETLSSYSGLQVPPELEVEFEKLTIQTKEEIIAAEADLELLRTAHPYNQFATWALEFLHECANRVDQEEQDCNQLETSEIPVLDFQLVQETNHSNKKKRRRKPENTVAPSPPQHPHTKAGPSNQELDGIQVDVFNSVDINVEQTEEEEYGLENELGSKGRYNPYRLGRGKGPTSAPRRRWTQQEYDLLLEEVRLHSNKYDCMAQIIKRHGRNGEISEILKDQNNVSLKDKARNLTMEWQRHGYPEDKPWLKEAFARFSVKNFKRSSNNSSSKSMEVENPDGNIPVHGGYENLSSVVGEEGESMNAVSNNVVQVGRSESLMGEEEHGNEQTRTNDHEQVNGEVRQSDQILVDQTTSIQVDQVSNNLPIEFEIHPTLIISSSIQNHATITPCLLPSNNDPCMNTAIHLPSSSSGQLPPPPPPNSDIPLSLLPPVGNILDGCHVDQLLDPNLLS